MVELDGLSRRIWEMKYRLHDPAGQPVDRTVEDTWRRVAGALAGVEAAPAEWADRFYGALEDFAFLPAGRILAGAGTDRAVTLFNCFVMGTIPDDMSGIFSHLREAALTLQQGGGIGYDFSTLRPAGAPVRGVGADASGPLSFMDVWDGMCRTIMSAGARRGAMMATLRCDHPDIEAFVDAKRDAARLRMFNLSVLVTDAFMEAVAAGADWPLVFDGQVYRTVPARSLWDRIMRATYETAEPGVVFIDRVNKQNTLNYCEEIYATNPCGEQPLPPYGACLLGSVNLARLIERPFTAEAALDQGRLDRVTALAVRMMDNVVDLSRFPLPEQAAEAKAKRRIGLGVTGLADALILCGVRYGSPDSVRLTGQWLARLKTQAYRTSAELAAEKGPFPLYDAEAVLAAPAVRALDEETQAVIRRHGLRNALLTSIAPTGTISLFADNVSSGIEPVFAYEFDRAVLMPDGSRRTERASDDAYRLYRRMFGDAAPLSEAFVTAEGLTPADHLAIQAAAQPHIDSAISKTINCPADLGFEDFKDVYAEAYRLGCKGCTTYRPNPITGAVLSTLDDTADVGEQPAEPAEPPAPAEIAPARPLPELVDGDVIYMTQPLDRPESLTGETYKLRWPDSDHALYVTVNDILRDGRRRPFEVFINSKNMEHYAWTVALTRMISAVFRRGGDVSFVVDELQAVFDPRGGYWMGGRYVPSLLAAIGEVIERHMVQTGFLPERPARPARPERPASSERSIAPADPAVSAGAVASPRQCPVCGQAAMARREGCDVCTVCGHSRCD